MSSSREICLTEEDGGDLSAVDEDLSAASCGDLREEALEKLDERRHRIRWYLWQDADDKPN